MDSTVYASSCNISGGSDYLYPSHSQLPLPATLPPSAHPYTVTPPESLASGVRDFGLGDVGRLSDVLEDERETVEVVEIKDVLIDGYAPSTASTVPVQMVNICPNKISKMEGEKQTTSRSSPLSTQMYLKEEMKDFFVNIETACNVPELMVMEGANGGVVIHKTVIAFYSKLVKQQLSEYPDCSIVYLPNYSQKILRKLVEILYTGETFYSEEEKKDVNLIWEAMRQLEISFNDKAFFYHPVEYTAVKEDVEGEESSEQQQSPSVENQLEVDQTDEFWYEDQSNNQNADAFSYCRIVRQPHPENPTKSVYVHSVMGEGRKIQRSMPALAHVNADEIRERESVRSRNEVEKLLAKHKPVVVDLVEEDEVDQSGPKKKMRTETVSAGTSVFRDQEFRNLVTSGKVNVNMLRTATLASSQLEVGNCVIPAVQNQLTASPNSQEDVGTLVESHVMSHDTPTAALYLETDGVPSLVIPPNRPDRTGITFVQISPGSLHESPIGNTSPAKSIPEMPKLQRVADVEETLPRTLRVRGKTGDITGIPKLDRIRDVNGQSIRSTESHVTGSINDNNVPDIVTAARVPVSKLNHFVRNDFTPVNSATCGVHTNPLQPMCTSNPGTTLGFDRKMRKRKQITLSTGDNDEIMRLREAYFQQQQHQEHQGAVIVVGSKKKAIPDDVKVDTYVENLEEGDDDNGEESNIDDQIEAYIHHCIDTPLILPGNEPNHTDVPSKNTPSNCADSDAVAGRSGIGSRKGRSRVAKPVVCDVGVASENQAKQKRGTTEGKGRSRGGRRRGGRS